LQRNRQNVMHLFF